MAFFSLILSCIFACLLPKLAIMNLNMGNRIMGNEKKGLNKNRLVVMAVGNIIGSGIFLGSSTVISVAGPAAILSYAIGGFIMAFEVMFITEMCVVNPAPGAFRVHATEIFGPWIGFVNGWMFWCSGVLGMASEVVAAATFSRFWFPDIPLWVFCSVYAAAMALVNLSPLRKLSRIEGILASVKVAALVMFLVLGGFYLIGFFHSPSLPVNQPFRSMATFFPNGAKGVLAPMVMVMFSYIGTGIIGLAIADTDDPAKAAPAAIRIITTLVSAIYVLSVLLIVLLTPENGISTSSSPLVLILNNMHIPWSDSILNFIVLTASLSGLNSSMYSSSRMLYSLGRDKQAPSLFLKTNRNGVPAVALMVSGTALLFTAILSYFLPRQVFVLLATASGFLAMINWLTISITHFFYRKKTLREHPEKLRYKVPGYPYTTFMEIALILGVFATSVLYSGQIGGLIGSLLLFCGLLIFYFALKHRGTLD